MNRFRLIAIGLTLVFAMTVVAQDAALQGNASADNPRGQGTANRGMPTVEDHLKFLSDKLALSEEQQTKARPILQAMYDCTEKVTQNKKLSDQERANKRRACHLRADTKMREILNDNQKQKLDQLEQDAHMDLHGHANASQEAK